MTRQDAIRCIEVFEDGTYLAAGLLIAKEWAERYGAVLVEKAWSFAPTHTAYWFLDARPYMVKIKSYVKYHRAMRQASDIFRFVTMGIDNGTVSEYSQAARDEVEALEKG